MKQNIIQNIVIAGPTASGKTKLSIDIALKVNGEIINADSMQILRKNHCIIDENHWICNGNQWTPDEQSMQNR